MAKHKPTQGGNGVSAAASRIENKGAESSRKGGNPAWRPGVSGNPGGRPKEVRELIELARSAVPRAFALAQNLLGDSDEESRVRLEAAKFLTSYGLGAPPRQVQVTDADGAPLFGMTDEQLEARLKAITAKAIEEPRP
jgi:hypothetical protein